MRVLFWSLTFWPNIGGMEVHAARLLPSLRELGYEFLVVAPKNYTDLPEHDRFDGIPIRRLAFQHTSRATIDHIAGVRAEVMQIKRSFAPDLVHINGVGAMGFFHLTTAHVHRSPVLAALHGDWGVLGNRLAAQTLRAANWVVACSAAILQRGLEVAPSIASCSSVLYNGIDTPSTTFLSPVSEPRLLYVGRLAEEKGADIAIDAFALLKQRVASARLTVAGEGPMRTDLEQRARALGVRDAIDFIGWVVPDRVMRLMGDHAAVIVPSRQDSFPLVALEAGAMARPVIASRVGGLPEIIEQHRTGVLVESGDRAGFADAASRLFADTGAAALMGRSARQRIETLFSWRQHVASYDALYRALVPQSAREPIAASQ